ncbi:MAG: SDR family oxidoreductase [Lachnospiraceae bacterium]|nr:SDR family oxidoreductase [Lachnospiraceae bacterium]
MTNRFQDKVVVITGGGSGIGRAMAVKLAKEGAFVVIAGRRESALKETAALNKNISYVVADITKTSNITDIVNFINKEYGGKIDVLINNAGYCPVQPLKDITLEDYDNAFNLDVRALVDMTIQSLPAILKAKGNIINLSTVGATHRAPNLSMYVGAKAAVENFTRCWAIELAADGVRVNAIAPGAVDTDIWTVPGLTEEQALAHRANIAKTIPCNRFAVPEEIANVAAFLASDEASYVSGAIYAVDGAQGAS